MRYFLMKQDRNLPYQIRLSDPDLEKEQLFFRMEDLEKIKDTTVLQLSEQGGTVLPGVIERPALMVTDELKQLFELYEDDLIFRHVVMNSAKEQEQFHYHLMILKERDLLSEKTEYFLDGSIKKAVLDRNKIGIHHILSADRKKIRAPIVSLAVVESLLRRFVPGIIFEEIEVDADE